MFRRIQRIGSTPCKFQYALVLKQLTLSLPLDGMEIQTVWTRGPHVCKSISAQSRGDGIYEWNFEEQKRQPMMLNCTLYKKDPKDKDKGNSDSLYQSKPCKITIKHLSDKPRTIGEVQVDLADHAVDKLYSHDFDMKVAGTKNIEATLTFTLHSRPLISGKESTQDTVSTIEGMDQSYIDNDSVADFSEQTNKNTNNNKQQMKKKSPGLDSESDSDDDDLEDVDAIIGNFGAAGKKAQKEAKKKNPFESDPESDDDGEVLAGFGKGTPSKTTTTSSSTTTTTTKSATTASSILGTTNLRDKYDNDSPEVSVNSRPSRLTASWKSGGTTSSNDKERLKQLEGAAIKADYQREQLEEKIQRLQNELAQEKEKNHNLEEELNLHDRNTKEIVDGIVLEWSTKVAELQVETKSLKSRITELEVQHEQRLRDALSQSDEEHKRLFSVTQDEVTQLKREVENLRGRKLAFDEVLETIRTNYGKHKLPDELKALTLQIKYYERQLDEADLTIDCVRTTYQTTNTVLMNEVRTLEDAKQQMKAALSEAAHTNNQLHQHNVVLETQCKKHTESRVKMSEILNSMEVLLTAKEEKLTAVQTENGELRLELLKLKKQLHRFQQGE